LTQWWKQPYFFKSLTTECDNVLKSDIFRLQEIKGLYFTYLNMAMSRDR
jgi:hypothetical protein